MAWKVGVDPRLAAQPTTISHTDCILMLCGKHDGFNGRELAPGVDRPISPTAETGQSVRGEGGGGGEGVLLPSACCGFVSLLEGSHSSFSPLVLSFTSANASHLDRVRCSAPVTHLARTSATADATYNNVTVVLKDLKGVEGHSEKICICKLSPYLQDYYLYIYMYYLLEELVSDTSLVFDSEPLSPFSPWSQRSARKKKERSLINR